MHLESSIVIRRPPEQVWSFLANVANIPKWDRGVAGIQRTTSEPMGLGLSSTRWPIPRRATTRNRKAVCPTGSLMSIRTNTDARCS
jgi:hypothetical protein